MKKILARLIVLLLAVSFYTGINNFIPVYAANSYYVATNGSDSNPGTEQEPFRTIQKAADMAYPGDTIIVKEGIYRERVAPPRGGTPGNPITYMAEEGKTVIIKGSDIWRPSWSPASSYSGVYCAVPDDSMFTDDYYWDNKNPFKVSISATPEGRDGFAEYEYGASTTANPDLIYTLGQVFVDGEMYHQRPFITEMAEEEKSWKYDENTGRIYIHFPDNNPKDHVVEITTRRTVFAPHEIGLGYINVEGFVIEHCGNQYPRDFWARSETGEMGAIDLRYGHHWTVKDNVIRYANTLGISGGFMSMDPQMNTKFGGSGYGLSENFDPQINSDIVYYMSKPSDYWTNDWTYSNCSVTTDVYADGFVDGTHSLRFESNSNAQRSFNLIHQNDAEIQGGAINLYWYSADTQPQDKLYVKLFDGTNWYTVISIDGGSTNGLWRFTEVDIPLEADLNSTLTLKIESSISTAGKYIYIDDLSIGENHKGGNLVEGNWMVDNGANGMIVSASKGFNVKDNVVMRNGSQKFVGYKRFETAGMKFHHFTEGSVTNNYITDNLTTGLWMDNAFYKSRVSKNIYINNDTQAVGAYQPANKAMMFEMSNYDWDALTVDNNILLGNMLYMHDSSGITFTNNLVANAVVSPMDAIKNWLVSKRFIRVDANSYVNNMLFDFSTLINIPYPDYLASVQKVNHNVYEAASTDRKFKVNKYSYYPLPWSSTTYYSMLNTDLGAASPGITALTNNDGALTYNEWKTFWNNKALNYDANSLCAGSGNSATYNSNTRQLTLNLNFDPSTVGSENNPIVTTDFFGNTIPQNGTGKPGPFQNITTGTNTFTIWNGKQLLAQNQLPYGLPSSNIVYRPVAKSQSYITAKGKPVQVKLYGCAEKTGNLTYTVVQNPSNGVLAGTAPNLTYTPGSNYTGTDTFTFKVNDGSMDSDTVTVAISIDGIQYEAFDGFESGNISGGTYWKSEWLFNPRYAAVTDQVYYNGNYCLALQYGSKAIRKVNMVGMGEKSAKLGFYWKTDGFESGDKAYVRVYDGSTWHDAMKVVYDVGIDQWQYTEVDLSRFTMSGDFRISFDCVGNAADDYFYVDDVRLFTTEGNDLINANTYSARSSNWGAAYSLIHDGIATSGTSASDNNETWIEYSFSSPQTITRSRLKEDNSGSYHVDQWKVQYYNGTWKDAFSYESADSSDWIEKDFADVENVTKVRMYNTAPINGKVEVYEFECYGYPAEPVHVPPTLNIVSSNTYTAKSSNTRTDYYNAYDGNTSTMTYASDSNEMWYEFSFNSPKILSKARVKEDNLGSNHINQWKVQYYNGSWQDAFSYEDANTSNWIEKDFADVTGATKIRLYCTAPAGGRAEVYEFECYALDELIEPLFYDGFENGLDSWTISHGTANLSETQAHSGDYSYGIDENIDAIKHTMSSNTNKVVTLYLYDDASDISMYDMAFADNTTSYVGLGINTSTSAEKYVYRIAGMVTATNIDRTTGWHQFVFDYRSGSDVNLYIDGNLVTTDTTVTSFNRILLADLWNDAKIGYIFFDDVSVQDNLPF